MSQAGISTRKTNTWYLYRKVNRNALANVNQNRTVTVTSDFWIPASLRQIETFNQKCQVIGQGYSFYLYIVNDVYKIPRILREFYWLWRSIGFPCVTSWSENNIHHICYWLDSDNVISFTKKHKQKN